MSLLGGHLVDHHQQDEELEQEKKAECREKCRRKYGTHFVYFSRQSV
jgi:glutathione peroxidase-family protein